MPTTVTPVLDDVFTALVAFLQGIVGTAPVVQGMQNRTAMPLGGFVVVTEILQKALATNTETYTDTLTNTPGTRSVRRSTRVDIQIDFYGPTAADWATMSSVLLRDPFACDALAPNCQPLYATDARLLPLVDGEQQYEARYMVEAVLQYNPIVSVSQQFFDSAVVTTIEVDKTYPP
jgi:hypothetical protein